MDSVLRGLVDLRTQIQKNRIQYGNRLGALERGDDPSASPRQRAVIERWYEVFQTLEENADKDIKEIVSEHIIYEHVTAVKGIGPMMAAKLLAEIDITVPNTVSGLWRFAGLAVFDGQRERPTKGQKLHYNKRLKTLMFLIAGQMIKARSPYVAIYYEWKEYYALNRVNADDGKPWSKLHCHLAAMRKMNRVFLEHLWRRWRTLEGLPAPDAYVYDILGHSSYMAAEDFGWPELD